MGNGYEPEPNGCLKDEAIKLFRNCFFNEWQQPRTDIIVMWDRERFSRISKDDLFKNLFEKVKDSSHAKFKEFISTSSAGTMVELKIIRSGQKHSETRSILLDFKKVEIITALISELLENIDLRDLESLFEKYFKRYRAEFIHLFIDLMIHLKMLWDQDRRKFLLTDYYQH